MLPKYSDPLGVYSTLPLLPPFFFQGMTARVFPLRASPFQIDVLCKTYVNFIPPEMGRFRAFMPFVFLMVLDYGKLAAPVANVGWLSQYEIMFAVPVEWYRVVDGRWEFVQWAWLTPFIYVDSELSLLLGRQTYGWPKSLMQFTPAMSDWMNDPTAPVRRATVSAMVLPELFVGDRQAPRVIMDISQDAGLLSSKLPPDLESPLMPWMALGNAVQTSAAMMGDLASILTGMGLLRAQPGADPDNYLRMMAVAAEMMNPYAPNIVFNTLNLKQFRDSRRPGDYCYQSLTNAPMFLRQVNAIGLLGDVNQLAGDATGGFRVDLHEWPGYPIAEMLGLQVARRWRGDGVDVAQLEPVFPFWYNVDMVYGRGENLAWRTFDTLWHAPDGAVRAPVSQVPGARPDPALERRYNSTLGVSSSQTAAGVFSFTDSTMRVLPLLARKADLQRFLDEYLNKPLGTAGADWLTRPPSPDGPEPAPRFQLWGPAGEDNPYAYVYMVATSYGTMVSPEANIGSWQSESLAILVPVRWVERVDGEEVLRGLGFVPAYTFTNSNQAVISSAEVLGIPMTKGVFVSPPNTWMSNTVALSANQALLQVSSEVLPAVDLGQQARTRRIIEIAKGPILADWDRDSWDRMVASPVWAIYQEHRRKKALRADAERRQEMKDARALALTVLAGDVPLNSFTLKQFRDVTWPEDACYQSVVRIQNVITQLYDLREIEDPIHVQIREYPTLPIMRMLGLVGHLAADQSGGGVVHELLPIRPFWFRVAWRQQLGEQLWHRSGSTQWKKGEPPPASYFDPARARDVPLRSLDLLLATGDPGDPRVLLQDSLDVGVVDEQPMTLDDARAAVGAIDPQLVIESMLSREWGHRGPDARWRVSRRALRADLTRRIETAASAQEARVVAAFFEARMAETVQRYDLRPGTPSYDHRRKTLDEFSRCEAAFAAVDQAYDELARLAAPLPAGAPAPALQVDAQAYSNHLFLFADSLYGALPPDDVLESPTERKLRRLLADKVERLVSGAIEQIMASALHGLSRDLLVDLFHLPEDEGAPGAGPAPAKAGGPPGPGMPGPPPGPRVAVAPPGPPGAGAAPEDEDEEAERRRMMEALWGWFGQNKELIQDIIRLLRQDRERRRMSLLTLFAKTAQKPDFCALRAAAGPDADRVFPPHASWDEHWYSGESPPEAEAGGPAGPDRILEVDVFGVPGLTPSRADRGG